MIKWIFGQKKYFLAERKNSRFPVIPARTGSIIILGHIFDGLDSSTKFCLKRSKIKGRYTYDPTQSQNCQKQGWALKNDP